MGNSLTDRVDRPAHSRVFLMRRLAIWSLIGLTVGTFGWHSVSWGQGLGGGGLGGGGLGRGGFGSGGPLQRGDPAGPAGRADRGFRYQPTGPQIPVAEIRIVGNQQVTTDRIRSYLQTRPKRGYDAELLQQDVRTLMSTRLFRDVRASKQETPDGMVITLEIIEQPTVQYVRFDGNDEMSERKLRKQADLKVGEPLNPYAVEEGRRKLEQFYKDKGFADAVVTVREGTEPRDQGVVYQIREGRMLRVYRTVIEGNTFMNDSVLKARAGIESKPGVAWVFGGRLNRQTLKQDEERLTAFYRRFGYFDATVRSDLEVNESGKWVTITFTVNEGPQFRVRDVTIVGNQVYDQQTLLSLLTLRESSVFVLDDMQRDLAQLRDFYGGEGYVFVDVRAEPTFLEESGFLDIVYQIEEGEQHYINNIVVRLRGDQPHTKHSVIKNYMGIAPRETIDLAKIRAAERRMKSSGLFMNDPASGSTPTITIKPSDEIPLLARPDLGRGVDNPPVYR